MPPMGGEASESLGGTLSVPLGANRARLSSRGSARNSKMMGSNVGRESISAKNSFTASRLEMMQSGVPDDYIDALLDEGYMERLIVANDHLNKKRRLRLQRYLRMNKIIFGFLCLQSLLGVFVALYKTVFQPDYLFNAQAQLQNIDLMVMMDTSKHMGVAMKVQHEVVVNFTQELNETLDDRRVDIAEEISENLTKIEAREEGFVLRYLPFLKYVTSHASATKAKVHGGWLRIATGTFNAQESADLHGFTRDMSVQQESLAKLTERDYLSSGQWLNAFKRCESIIQEGGHQHSKKFCVLIGDNEAMCRKHVSDEVSEMCKKFPMLCPPDLDKVGNLIEYEEEMKYCTDFVEQNLTVGASTQVIMMFTVKSRADEQHRLSNSAFRNFVKGTTNCSILQKIDPVTTETTYEPDESDDSCLRFIMALDFESLAEKSKKVAKLLQANTNIDKNINEEMDWRYLFFLILPLNLVFYIIWSKLLRCTMHVKKTANRAMGVKKKMIKVTKTLVEKPRRDSMVELFEANLTEVEMAEVSSLRPVVECGSAMTLRGRLKGGYLRMDPASGDQKADGNGRAFDEMSNLQFEPIDMAREDIKGSGLQGGQKVKIRNALGKVLRIGEDGSAHFVDDKTKGGFTKGGGGLDGIDEDGDLMGADGTGGEEAQEFIVEQLDYCEGEEYNPTRLGDAVRLKCAATGKFVRIHKDGRCDGIGDYGDTETQMTVDLGGNTIATNAVVTLKSAATGAFMFGDSEGQLSAFPGGDTWKYWQLEKKEDGGDAGGDADDGEGGDRNDAQATRTDVGGTSTMTPVGNLKVGDVVTLRGINQNMLEVAKDGTTCHAGKLPKSADDPDGGASGSGDDAGSGCQEFIVERVGMGILQKHDNTVRSGAQICLRPKTGPGSDNAVDASNYLNADADGSVTADGRVTNRGIGFTMEIATMQDMVTPISDHLLKGDMEIMISPLWNKNEVKRLEALSAPWTSEDDLSRFRGAVVVANEKGQYSVPKAKGESFQGWVAVIQDGVDIVKASRQAKAQGATGLIIKTSEVLSMDKLARNTGQEQPELPAVYCDETVALELNERGITLKGCEFKGKNRTAALRSIGRAGVHGDEDDMSLSALKTTKAGKTADVFKNVGALMCEKAKEEAEAAEREPVGFGDGTMEIDVDDEGSAGKGFQWKVASNTHYLWSTSGGGATRMNVNYGQKAPPSAKKKLKVNIATGEVDESADASINHVRPNVVAKKKIRVPEMEARKHSIVGVTMIDGEDLKAKTIGGFADELGEVMTEAQAAAPQEQLPDDSDFKIEYAFEEVEVAVGEKAEDIIEEELIDDSGAVVGRFAVPAARFWMVAGGMLLSTVTLSMLLLILMKTSNFMPEEEEGPSVFDQGLDDASPVGNDVMFAANMARGVVDAAWNKVQGSSVLIH